MTITVRLARREDERALIEIDDATWSSLVSPAPRPAQDRRFRPLLGEAPILLVAERASEPAGVLWLRPVTSLDSNSHVLEVAMIAVAPEHARSGVGSALIGAAETHARDQGARKLRLRVLDSNPGAVAFYRALGFELEGRLRGEFLIDGAEVDDLLMAKRLGRR